jgi:hypothetical protein
MMKNKRIKKKQIEDASSVYIALVFHLLLLETWTRKLCGILNFLVMRIFSKLCYNFSLSDLRMRAFIDVIIVFSSARSTDVVFSRTMGLQVPHPPVEIQMILFFSSSIIIKLSMSIWGMKAMSYFKIAHAHACAHSCDPCQTGRHRNSLILGGIYSWLKRVNNWWKGGEKVRLYIYCIGSTWFFNGCGLEIYGSMLFLW